MGLFLAAFLGVHLIAQTAPSKASTPAPTSLERLPGTGLNPLQPPPGAAIGKDLKTEPQDQALSIRQMLDTDKISYLRSQGEWYEVEVQSLEGLEFRGWLKSVLAPARKLSDPKPQVQIKPEIKPLTSDRFIFFWDNRSTQRGSLKISGGPQQIAYSLKGRVIDESGNASIQRINPGYEFLGGHIGLEGDFIPMALKLGEQTALSPIIKSSYAYGLHRVSFSNPFAEVPEISGQAYSIETNTYQIEVRGRVIRRTSSAWDLSAELGLGFFFHEVSPDLDPIPGGNELVFVEQSTSAMTVPLRIAATYSSRFYFHLDFKPLVFASLKETPEVTPNLKLTGLSWMGSSFFGWQFAKRFALEAGVDLMDLKASGQGSATRLDQEFTDGHLTTEFRKAHLGIRWKF